MVAQLTLESTKVGGQSQKDKNDLNLKYLYQSMLFQSPFYVLPISRYYMPGYHNLILIS